MDRIYSMPNVEEFEGGSCGLGLALGKRLSDQDIHELWLANQRLQWLTEQEYDEEADDEDETSKSDEIRSPQASD